MSILTRAEDDGTLYGGGAYITATPGMQPVRREDVGDEVYAELRGASQWDGDTTWYHPEADVTARIDEARRIVALPLRCQRCGQPWEDGHEKLGCAGPIPARPGRF